MYRNIEDFYYSKILTVLSTIGSNYFCLIPKMDILSTIHDKIKKPSSVVDSHNSNPVSTSSAIYHREEVLIFLWSWLLYLRCSAWEFLFGLRILVYTPSSLPSSNSFWVAIHTQLWSILGDVWKTFMDVFILDKVNSIS